MPVNSTWCFISLKVKFGVSVVLTDTVELDRGVLTTFILMSSAETASLWEPGPEDDLGAAVESNLR